MVFIMDFMIKTEIMAIIILIMMMMMMMIMIKMTHIITFIIGILFINRHYH